jgi:hypothetical protein
MVNLQATFGESYRIEREVTYEQWEDQGCRSGVNQESVAGY